MSNNTKKRILSCAVLASMSLMLTQTSHAQDDLTAGHTVSFSRVGEPKLTAYVLNGEYVGNAAEISLAATLSHAGQITDPHTEAGQPIGWSWDLTGLVYIDPNATGPTPVTQAQLPYIASVTGRAFTGTSNTARLNLPTISNANFGFTWIANVKATAYQGPNAAHPNGWIAFDEHGVGFTDPGALVDGGGGGGTIAITSPNPNLA